MSCYPRQPAVAVLFVALMLPGMSEYKPISLSTPPNPPPLIRSVFPPPPGNPRAESLPIVEEEEAGDRVVHTTSPASSSSPSGDHGFRDHPMDPAV